MTRNEHFFGKLQEQDGGYLARWFARLGSYYNRTLGMGPKSQARAPAPAPSYVERERLSELEAFEKRAQSKVLEQVLSKKIPPLEAKLNLMHVDLKRFSDCVKSRDGNVKPGRA